MLNLGSPETPETPDVASYLHTFLTDRRVVGLSKSIRHFLVDRIIVPRRAPKSAANYRTIWDEEKEADDLSERTQRNLSRSELEATWMAKLGEQGCVFISAKTGEGIEELKQLLYDRAKEIHVQRFPYNDFLFQDYSALAGEEEVSAP